MTLVKKTIVDLKATLLGMNAGESLEIKPTDAPEGRIRTVAFRLSKTGDMKFYVSVAGTSGTTKVTRVS